jgi:predicted RNA methylase
MLHTTNISEGQTYHHRNQAEFDRIYSDIFRNNEYEIQLTGKSPNVIDCGAHIGLSIGYLKLHYPNAKVIAFEPNPETYQILQQNISLNNWQGIELHNAAVSDTSAHDELIVAKELDNP